MKKILLTGLLSILVTSCNYMEGSFTALDDIVFSKKSIPMGTYKAKLKMSPKKNKIVLKVKLDGNVQKVKFKIPEGTSVPRGNGELRLTAAQVGQPYDILGKISTKVANSPNRSGYEQCSYNISRRFCHINRNGHRVCYGTNSRIYGQRWVEFFVKTTDQTYELSLFEKEQLAALAMFNGGHRSVERIILNSSPCRRY